MTTLHFYKRIDNGGSDFFDSGVLKRALSEVLVPFYPVAGRLGRDKNGRVEIVCNEDGVLFVEAESDCVIDELGESIQTSPLPQLVPPGDDGDLNLDISSFPLLLVQLTRFKCGGVCLGIGLHHIPVDGISAMQIINSWADVARGLPITITPFIDRTILRARDPPSPTFNHPEYDPPPSLITAKQIDQFQSNSTFVVSVTRDHLQRLKARAIDGGNKAKYYTTYEIFVAHTWRCVSKARGLAANQATRVHVAVNGRSRLFPPLPEGYVGNVIFHMNIPALACELESEHLSDTVQRIHGAIKKMDDGYMKSALDYLELHPNLDALVPKKGNEIYRNPNLSIVSWNRLPMDSDFGWGPAMYVRPASIYTEGKGYLLASPRNDERGFLSLVLCLETRHVQDFKKLFYDV